MNPLPPLPPDDLPPFQTEQGDVVLRRQLEDSLGRRFYETCDGVTQALLTSCEWYVTTDSTALTLVINCPDTAINWRILNNIVSISTPLAELSTRAKIRVGCPGGAPPFEIRVDEISLYRDSL